MVIKNVNKKSEIEENEAEGLGKFFRFFFRHGPLLKQEE